VVERPSRPPGGDPAQDLLDEGGWGSADRWRPSLDVFETEKAIVVRVELGGVRGTDVKVTVDDDAVHVRGVRRPPGGAEVMRPHRMEIAFGPFERTIRVAIPFDRDTVVASLEDGFLTVTLPRRQPSRRRIEVQNENPEGD